jgi:hypothetical protein
MNIKTKTHVLLSLTIAVLLTLISIEHNANAEQPNTVFTPVVVSVLNAPNPVKGSDGMYHLVYELEALNATGLAWTIDSVQVLGDGKSIAVINGEELDNRMELIKDRSPSTTIQPGESAVIFVHVQLEEGNVPANLSHRVTFSVPNGIPEGFKNFAGIPVESEVYTYMAGVTPVGSSDAIVISPPLEGQDWIAADGCCDSTRHIRAMMPINDRLNIAQRFAIDWETINNDKRIFVGDSKDVNSYFAYGKNVLAVADAKVVAAVDKYGDQVPGGLPAGMTLEEADGNHIVLDLGGGKYALYAHLKPGSVKVKEGDTVKRGQVMAQVGNTGNTTAPHLHFHVMDGASTLGSNGLPYVIDSFEVTGQVPSTEAFDKAEAEGTPLEIIVVDQVGTHENELPLDQRVVNFPAGSKK